jgi:acetyl-CoA carboxylase biotin carboxyl carrier protein
MRLEEIRNLVKLLEESGIAEIEVSRWWGRIRVSKDSRGAVGTTSIHGNGASRPAAPADEQPASLAPVEPASPVDEERYQLVRSPMVGTFYRAPAPDADPYVEVGQLVEVGQTLCIIEAMKLMNEIESDLRGRVVEIAVENTQPVEYGQVLFKIEPV